MISCYLKLVSIDHVFYGIKKKPKFVSICYPLFVLGSNFLKSIVRGKCLGKRLGHSFVVEDGTGSQARGNARKRRLIDAMGGACKRCGYDRNPAALVFHHKVTGDKKFQLDLRALSNRRWSSIEAEAAKCELLCANCHAEVHNPLDSDEERALKREP